MSAGYKEKKTIAIFLGTALQERITKKILPALQELLDKKNITLISLQNYYQFDINLCGLGPLVTLNSCFAKPWYHRHPVIKLISLAQFFYQLFFYSRRFDFFLFFVDTGILERTAIIILKFLGCRTIVLQDGLKRRPKNAHPRSLTWFGAAGADLYLLMGHYYRSMVRNGHTEVVGSPIYSNQVNSLPLGRKILLIDGCYALYGEMTTEKEFRFFKNIIETVSEYGPIEFRLHPHTEPERYLALQSQNVEITWKRPISRSLKDAGVVLSVNSSVILEALALGRPVFTLDWHPSPFEQPVKAGVTPCYNIEDMKSALTKWKNSMSRSQKSFYDIENEISNFISYSGEDATWRIAEAIIRFTTNRTVLAKRI